MPATHRTRARRTFTLSDEAFLELGRLAQDIGRTSV